MANTGKIIIAGAGGIGRAVALILGEISEQAPMLFLGNRTMEKAREVTHWLALGTTRPVRAEPVEVPEDGGMTESMHRALREADVLLDCLPGSEAPRMAALAKEYGLHYANLTEHVEETNQIASTVRDAGTGFLLQTGLAPGFINVLAQGLFRRFCRRFKVKRAASISMKVGALTRHATAPHFYGFTWSPAGVAAEYINDIWCIRNGHKQRLPALSEREFIIINGQSFEADLTSGGAADLPEAFEGLVDRLDYKTLRYPGHYNWVANTLRSAPDSVEDRISFLQRHMEDCIPAVEDDQVLIFASVEGKDKNGVWQKLEKAYLLHPQLFGRHTLRAIQTTTAAPLAQAADFLLTKKSKGLILQSQINPDEFLSGRFITAVYGRWEDKNVKE